jgi:NAD-dependent DNA ligase
MINTDKLNAAKQTSQSIFLLGTRLDDITFVEIIDMLKAADDLYHNDSESFLTDAQYDSIRRYAEKSNPSDEYFTGIGSDVRGGKVKLPYPMGSLTQAYDDDTIFWVSKHGLHRELVDLSDKLDGTSAELLFSENGDLQIAYSRGNGIEGADITRHVSRIPNVPKNVGQKLVIRGEIIISEANFSKMRTLVTRSDGSLYKTARNTVAGLMNSSENPEIAYQYIDFIAYQIIVPTVDNKTAQFDMLTSLGFDIPHVDKVYGDRLTDEFLINHLNERRELTEYAIDGIVIEVDDEQLRKTINPSKDTLNPEYARKFKIASDDNTAVATVVSIELNISKHGYIKPTIIINPVELVGVTISRCTGFNMKFIYENKIQPGCKISITRAGDVIPFCTGVISPMPVTGYEGWFNAQLNAIGDWAWTDTMVDAYLLYDHPEQAVEKAKDFFSTLDVAYLGEGNIQKLFDAGIDSPAPIIQATEADLVAVIGENGRKIYKSIVERLTNVPIYKLMGASGCFGRGVGTRKLKKLYEAFGGDIARFNDGDSICAVDGFDTKTAVRITAGVASWNLFYADILEYVTIAPYTIQVANNEGELYGQIYVFTGFRDGKLEEALISKGGEIANSYNKRVTCVIAKDPAEKSTKLQKARKDGANIIGIAQAWELVE